MVKENDVSFHVYLPFLCFTKRIVKYEGEVSTTDQEIEVKVSQVAVMVTAFVFVCV